MRVNFTTNGTDLWPKERRNVFADEHGKPMPGAFTHLIAMSWASADTFRRSLIRPWGVLVCDEGVSEK
jgi:hypothetical protein